MVSEEMKEFAKAVKEKKYKKARSLVRDLASDKKDISKGIEDVPEIDSDLVDNIKMRGFESLEKLAKAPIQKLVKIPEFSEGRAKNVLDSARDYVADDLTKLPNVGGETAMEMIKNGLTSFADVSRSTVDDLKEIQGIGKKGAEKIIEKAKEESITSLEELPGVGGGTVEKMKEEGFTPLGYIAESTPQELSRIPNVGKKGAEKIIEFAKDNPKESVKDLPGVGEETAEEIIKHGYTAINFITEKSAKELSEVPNIGKKGAQEILEVVREKTGGKLEDLDVLVEEEISLLRDHGFHDIGDIASSKLEELIKVPKLQGGKANDVKKSAEKILRDCGGDADGYERALRGVITSLKDDKILTLPHHILDKKYSSEKLEEIQNDIRTKSTNDFRPANEQGYFDAWNDLIDAFISLDEEDN